MTEAADRQSAAADAMPVPSEALRLRRWRTLALASSAVAALGWGAFAWSSGGPPSEASQPSTQPPPAAIDAHSKVPGSGAKPSQPPAAAPAQPIRGEGAAAALASALASDDTSTRIDALRQARDQNAVEVLPQLLSFDLARDPDAAPTVVSAAAQLAQQASPQQQAATAERMASWLAAESARDSEDARGNVAMIVEALGQLHAPQAVTGLVGALDAQHLPVHVATVAVQGLARLGDPAARDAVQRFRDRLQQAPATDDAFEDELRHEAQASADQALAQLAH